MRLTTLPLAALLLAIISTPVALADTMSKDDVPAYITKAMADPSRDADRDDDARRQMAAVMAFTQVKPGDKVMELVPGRGYWTRVFSLIAGPSGHVYQVWPNEMMRFSQKSLDQWQDIAKSAPYTNVSVLTEPAASPAAPESVDIAFTCQNYHDYHDPFMGPVDMAVFNKQVYSALKPGGVFVVIDHAAPAGSGISDTNTLHRIDPDVVKKEVEAAGFVFDGSSDVLKNPDDPRDIKVFDKSIRGHTDQFIYRFRKPMS